MTSPAGAPGRHAAGVVAAAGVLGAAGVPGLAVDAADATEEAWRRLARPVEATAVADALFGLGADVVEAIGAVKVCVGEQATALLAAMPGLCRSLTTSVSQASVRTRGEVRGPVLWSETASVRASSFGGDDVYVCVVPQRDYDTPANRALVEALHTLERATAAIDRAPAAWRDDPRLQRARAASRAARHWLDHPGLARVGGGHVTARELVRVRGGKAAGRYRPVLDLLDAAREPLGPRQLLPLCDRRTRLEHWALVALVREIEARGPAVPPWRVEGRTVLAGPVTFVHHRHRRHDGTHGILLGNVRVTVDTGDGRGTTGNAGGRHDVVIRSASDVVAVVDVAVREARRSLEGS